MIIFSHRGLGFGKDENSLDSFETALKEGFSIEVDVMRTRDGKLVISHDISLFRQKEIDKNVTEMDFDELIDLGIPSFENVLESLRDHGKDGQLIAIHIKDELQSDIIELVVNMIREKEMVEKCFIFDLTTNGINHAKQLCPKLKQGLSVGEKKFTGSIYLWDEVSEDLNMDIIWWDEWKYGLYNRENAKLIKDKGKVNYVISPELHKVHDHPMGGNFEDVKKVWGNLIEMDVDGICTDYPKELREVFSGEKKD